MEPIEAVKMLAAIAQESRMTVFRNLAASADPISAGTLAETIGIPANTLSFHLKELATAGLVTPRRQGRTIYYVLNEANVSKLMCFLLKDCCEGRPSLCGFDLCAEPTKKVVGKKTTLKKKSPAKLRG